MERFTGKQSLFLRRLAEKLANGKDSALADLLRDETDTGRSLQETDWQRFEKLPADFDSQLAYADSFLADAPPPSRVKVLLDNSSPTRKVAILQRLLERAYSLRLYGPQEGLRITEDLIAWTRFDPSRLVAAIRCRALMERGNFLRILGNPVGAYAALEQAARDLAAERLGDRLDWARLRELVAALKADCGDFDSAHQLMNMALSAVRRWGDSHSRQRVLIALGIVELSRNNFEHSQALLAEAMDMGDPDALLIKYAATNLVYIHFASGDPAEAYRSLLSVRHNLGRSWLREFPERARTRQTWIEGQILTALGADDDAIGLLKKAREFYIRSSLGFEVCYISLDLAMNHAAHDRLADVRRELAFGLPFCSERSARDGYARDAALLLQATLRRQGRISADQIRTVSAQLDWIQSSPLQVFYRPPYSRLRL